MEWVKGKIKRREIIIKKSKRLEKRLNEAVY